MTDILDSAWTVAVLEGTVDGVPLTRDQLRLGFTLFDWDGDGTVDPQNFSDTLLRLNPQKKAEYFRIAKESGVLGGMGSFESFCEPPLPPIAGGIWVGFFSRCQLYRCGRAGELYIKAASGASVWASNSPLRLAFEEFECEPRRTGAS